MLAFRLRIQYLLCSAAQTPNRIMTQTAKSRTLPSEVFTGISQLSCLSKTETGLTGCPNHNEQCLFEFPPGSGSRCAIVYGILVPRRSVTSPVQVGEHREPR